MLLCTPAGTGRQKGIKSWQSVHTSYRKLPDWSFQRLSRPGTDYTTGAAYSHPVDKRLDSGRRLFVYLQVVCIAKNISFASWFLMSLITPNQWNIYS
jgi:hypothetical protein